MHGSPVAVERLLAAAVAAGARPARPGEFTERAFRSGKIDLVRAEAVRDLIEARTPAAARASARRLAGGLSRRIERVREDLLAASAGLAAAIDFSDDVGEGLAPAVLARLARAVAALDAARGDGRPGAPARPRLPRRDPRPAQRREVDALQRARRRGARDRDGEFPARRATRSRRSIDVGGIPVTLVDTAGLRETDDVVETIGVERARAEGERADAIVYVFDAAEGFERRGRTELVGAGRRAAAHPRREQGGPPPAAAIPAGAAAALRPRPRSGPRPAGSCAARARRRRLDRGDVRGARLAAPARSRRARPAPRPEALGALTGGLARVRRHPLPRRARRARGPGGGDDAEDVLARLFETFCIGK